MSRLRAFPNPSRTFAGRKINLYGPYARNQRYNRKLVDRKRGSSPIKRETARARVSFLRDLDLEYFSPFPRPKVPQGPHAEDRDERGIGERSGPGRKEEGDFCRWMKGRRVQVPKPGQKMASSTRYSGNLRGPIPPRTSWKPPRTREIYRICK